MDGQPPRVDGPRARPTPHLDELVEFMHGHRKKALFFIDRLDRFAAAQGRPPGDITVLEVGCSHGRNVALPLAERGYRVLGIDLHEGSIESARAHSALPNAEFRQVLLEELPNVASFDVMIVSDVLEHVEDPEAMIREALLRLRPGGLVLVSIPNGYGPYEIEERLTGTVLRPVLWATGRLVALAVRARRNARGLPWPPPDAEKPAYNHESGHLQFFSFRAFGRLLHRSGLEIVAQRNGSWFGGDLTYYVFYFIPKLTPLTLAVADRLPPSLVSSWYFECRRTVESLTQ